MAEYSIYNMTLPGVRDRIGRDRAGQGRTRQEVFFSFSFFLVNQTRERERERDSYLFVFSSFHPFILYNLLYRESDGYFTLPYLTLP